MNNSNSYYKQQLLSSPLYLCCQPGYFTEGLDYKEFYVPRSSKLRGTVSMFYEASSLEKSTSFPVIPDGCIDVVISFRGNSCKGISVCGTISTLYYMELKNCDYIFGIRFMPGKFPIKLIGDIEEYIDEQKELLLMNREQSLIAGLMRSRSFCERINSVAQYIGALCETEGNKEKIVQYAMDYICRNNGNVAIKSLSSELIYSPRYIERVFKEYTGFSPKSMCKIARVHKAVMLLLWKKNMSRTDISMECGYSDLSHMNREIRSMLGVNSDIIDSKNFYRNILSEIETVYRF